MPADILPSRYFFFAGCILTTAFGPTEIYPTDPRGENGRFRAISAYDNCRCLCLNHRGIKARPECHDQAQCLVTLPSSLIVEAVSHLFSHSPLNSKPLTSDLTSKSKPDRNAGRHPDSSR